MDNMRYPKSKEGFTSITVKAIPKELIKHILHKQFSLKQEKGVGQYSQSATIVVMLKEHKDFTDKK